MRGKKTTLVKQNYMYNNLKKRKKYLEATREVRISMYANFRKYLGGQSIVGM